MERFAEIIDTIGSWVWGLPLIILLVGTGLWLSFILRFIQFRKLWYAFWLAFVRRVEPDSRPGDITHFQALMTALSATVGTGNIAGVATAIAIGGPPALFWMWLTGLAGMATKYAEGVLAVKYRITDENGEMAGGPMYYLSNGLNLPWLGSIFAVFATFASFGIGNLTQANSMAHAVEATFQVPPWITGIIIAVVTGFVILGGIQSIGKVTGFFVPAMILFYVGGAGVILILNYELIPDAFRLIVGGALSPTAATGGFAGATVASALRVGVARGIFSNESGLGSAPIAAAAAQTRAPVIQALVSMTQTFIDTIIVCTMTGLIIVMSGAWTEIDPTTNQGYSGAELTTIAFDKLLPGGSYLVTIGLILFAYSTILGWSYYGERSLNYLFGTKLTLPYRIVFVILIAVGSVMKLELVWSISDILNGLMAFPNLVGLLLLTPVIVKETHRYFDDDENMA